MVKVNVPAAVGVPERSSPVWLSVMSDLSARPGGSWPASIDQVYGIEPPLTENTFAYFVPTVADGSADDPLIFSGGGWKFPTTVI